MFHIRSAEPEDYHDIAELIKRSILNVENSQYSKQQLEQRASRFISATLKTWANNGVQFYVATMQDDDKASIAAVVGWKGSHLYHLYTSPEWQRKGAAKQLLEWAETQQRQAGGAWLWCNASLDATDFYSKNGYLCVCSGVLPKTDIPVRLMHKVV